MNVSYFLRNLVNQTIKMLQTDFSQSDVLLAPSSQKNKHLKSCKAGLSFIVMVVKIT